MFERDKTVLYLKDLRNSVAILSGVFGGSLVLTLYLSLKVGQQKNNSERLKKAAMLNHFTLSH